MRTQNALKNLYITIFQKVVDLILLFIQRTVFIRVLGVTYLGVSGLFSNIFTIFSLMELGIGSSIIYLLYKPLADGDKEEISKLMQIYKKFYNAVGIGILIIGIVLIPGLKYIVNMNNGIDNLYLIYLLTLFSTSVSYFFSYKRSLLEADQKLYISNLNIFVFNSLATVLRIIVLILFENYLLFLTVTIVMSFISNLVISRKVSKMYPDIKFNQKIKLKEINLKPIFSRMFAVSLNSIGNVVLTGTDNIIMSMYVGLTMVGLYSNYYMFTNMIYTTVSWLFISVTAGVGNLFATKEKENAFIVFKRMNFINYYFYFICCIMLFAFVNPLISIWIGNSYLFGKITVFIIVLNLFMTGMRHTNVTFINASGLYYNIKYKPIIEAIINLVLSLILAKFMGVNGILLGTFISLFCVSMWLEPYILYKEWFKKDWKEYFVKFFGRMGLMLVLMFIIEYIISICNITNILLLILLAFTVFIILNIVFIIIYHKKEEFKYYFDLISNILKKILEKVKSYVIKK